MTIPLGKKYLAGKWANIYCDDCHGRSCQQPIILAALYFLYVWDIMLFGTVAIEKQSLFYVGVLIAIFLILDYFNYYVPLVAMKKLVQEEIPEEAADDNSLEASSLDVSSLGNSSADTNKK